MALVISGFSIVGVANIKEEQPTESVGSYIVYGEIQDAFGAPVDTAIVVAVNENTGNIR